MSPGFCFIALTEKSVWGNSTVPGGLCCWYCHERWGFCSCLEPNSSWRKNWLGCATKFCQRRQISIWIHQILITFRHIVVPIKLIKGDKHAWFIVFLNFEYGSKAAIFLFIHQNEKNTILGNFKAFRKNIGVVDCLHKFIS